MSDHLHFSRLTRGWSNALTFHTQRPVLLTDAFYKHTPARTNNIQDILKVNRINDTNIFTHFKLFSTFFTFLVPFEGLRK